ncbi:MAG: hypothetical protein V8S39_12345 [Lachnospiraceae bacterium]|jgi:Na+-driven multidrug efflux pump
MSQEKIDKRKAEKTNRKKQLAKKKQKRIINIFLSVLVTVAFIAVVCLAAASLSGRLGSKSSETSANTITLSAEQLSSLLNQASSSTDGSSNASADTTAAEGADQTKEETTAESAE